MPRCYISLGANVGDVVPSLRNALQRLAAAGHTIRRTSRIYRTAPVGPHAGGAFLNACAILETSQPPHQLLHELQTCEASAGRTRSTRWGERPLDLDLLMYGSLILGDPHLTLPHPGLTYRRFVLDPLAEIAPRLVHPVVRRTIAGLKQRLLQRPLKIQLACQNELLRRQITTRLVERWSDVLEIKAHDRNRATDPTIILVDDTARSQPASRSRPARTGGRKRGGIRVRPDATLYRADPVAAVVAIVAAMLDEPQPIGPLDIVL